jgi:hypothetical protein
MRWTLMALIVALAGCGGDETNDQPDGSADTDSDTDFDFDTDYPYDLDAGLRCDGGVDIMQPAPNGEGEIPTGVERCPDGTYHRYTTVPCTNKANTVDDGCDQDACDALDCAPGQVCVNVFADLSPCSCHTPCASDADCTPDEACMCTFGSVAYCESADCRTDADCGGFECGLSFDSDCGELEILGCHSPSDECQNSEQCDGPDECVYSSDDWYCMFGECD